MAHRCDWCWMTRTALETAQEVAQAQVAEHDAAGESATAQSHADDVAHIQACLDARDAAEDVPGMLGVATLRDLRDDLEGASVKGFAKKAPVLLGALVGASVMRWW